MMLVASMTNDNEVIAAAALHDVVEDTPITIAEIEAEFGQKIAFYVAHESENKREDRPKSETWKIRKQEQLEKTKDASQSVWRTSYPICGRVCVILNGMGALSGRSLI